MDMLLVRRVLSFRPASLLAIADGARCGGCQAGGLLPEGQSMHFAPSLRPSWVGARELPPQVKAALGN